MARKQSNNQRLARRLMLLSLLISAIGVILIVYWMYFRIQTVRVAVSNPAGEDTVILNAINDWMVSERRRYRLKIIPTGSPAASLEKLRLGEVEIASARADRVSGSQLTSIMVLFNEAAAILMPEGGQARDWGSLNRVTIGVPRGTSPDDPLLHALLRLNGVAEPRIVSLETENVRTAFQRRQVQALGVVSPIPGYAARNFSLYFDPKKEVTLPQIDDPDMFAAQDTRFTATTIVAGSLRSSPMVPDEAIGTLSVGRHLLVQSETNNFLVAHLVRAFLDARRALFTAQPLLAQAGAPSVEADAYVKVHAAAKKIYNGDEPSWADMALEWVYIIPMILGGIGTLAVWMFQRYVNPEFTDPSDLVTELLDIRIDAGEADNEADLHALKVRIDAVAEELTGEAYEYADIEGTGAVLTAMLIAENRINERRFELRDPGYALRCPPPQSAAGQVVQVLTDAQIEKALDKRDS